jgi:hypothetical protein
VLPSYWKDNTPVLRIKDLPMESAARGETLIVRLNFGHALPGGGATTVEWQG